MAERARTGTPLFADSSERTPAWDLVAVVAAKAIASFAILQAGFFALSDDDFSRVVIAERFAAAPSLDPSGTSWLPLPFWFMGSALAAFGRTLSVARAAALVLGLVSAVLVHRAARFLGVSRAAAVLGAVVATTVPTAARLGVSFQPEALTTGLVLLGAAASAGGTGARRLAGACCLAAACLCRYDAWPVAAGFALCSLADLMRGGAGATPAPPPSRRALVVAALVACVAPVAWLAHGVLTHGDALFFMHRVAAYRHALGVRESFVASLLAYPVLLATAEPELTLGALGFLVAGDGCARPSRLETGFHRLALLLGALVVFLVLGRLFDGAPTHHAERTLLPVWTGLSVLAAERALSIFRDRPTPRAFAVPALALALGIAIHAVRPAETFGARASERAIGAAARTLVPGAARLLVDTEDYGYFAVIAAFGAPERAEPVNTHDPREVTDRSASSASELVTRRIADTGATFLIVPRGHWELALARGVLVATRTNFALVKLDGR